MSDSTVALFMAHFLSESVVKEFRRLKDAGSPSLVVKMLYDNSRGDFDPSGIGSSSDYFLYEVQDLAEIYPFLHLGGHSSLIPGNCIFPMLLFARKHPDFSSIWRIEYDTRFNGEWSYFFSSFVSNRSDLLGTTIFRYSFRPDWIWWSSLEAPVELPSRDWWLRGFFPVLRLSQRACQLLEEAYRDGWRGHEEVAIPTILRAHNYSLEDIGGDGEFVNPKNRNRFYRNTPNAPGLTPGTFVYRPHHNGAYDQANMLYHPIKT